MTFSGIIMFTRGVGLATPDNIAMLCMGTPILHYNFVTWTGGLVGLGGDAAALVQLCKLPCSDLRPPELSERS